MNGCFNISLVKACSISVGDSILISQIDSGIRSFDVQSIISSDKYIQVSAKITGGSDSYTFILPHDCKIHKLSYKA